jgi:hypothetical protein
MGAIKSTYHWIAALALIHLLLLGGGIAFLFGTGRADTQRLQAAFEALTAAAPKENASKNADDDDMEAPTAAPAPLSPAEQRVRDEIAWRNAERYRTQIEQRLKLINAARVEVDQRREEFENLQAKVKAERLDQETRESVVGYAKQVEVLAALAPKAALQQIMTMDDVEAARIFFELGTRKVKKIVEAARSDEQQAKITGVLALLPDVKNDDAGEGSEQNGGS